MGFLRIISPLWVAVSLMLGSGWVMMAGSLLPSKRLGAFVVFLVCALTVIAVAVKWATSSEGVRDWSSGGVASIVQDNSRRITWSDWAIVITRAGSIDIRTQRLRLETRVFLGLIPWEVIDRQLTAFDSVEAVHHYYESRDKDGQISGTYDHAVELHRADGQPIRLFDLSGGTSGDTAAALVDRLGARIKAAIRRT